MAPFTPTVKALVEAEVMVCTPDVIEPVEVKLFDCIASVPPIVRVVRVPNEVMADCAAPVTEAAVPETLPVTFPVSGPAKPVAVRMSVVELYVRPESVAGASEPVAEVPRAMKVVVSPPASAKVTVPAFPETEV